jgi:quinol monooxygenase YgiN
MGEARARAYTRRHRRPERLGHGDCKRRQPMITRALFVRLETKPGKEDAVAKFLETSLALARQEKATPVWFALRLSPATFAVFDAFYDEAGRQSHLAGPIAQALMAQAEDLFAVQPSIEPIDVLGCKTVLAAASS